MSDILPRFSTETVYLLGQALRRSWKTARPTHIFVVERIKIGTSYHGKPIYSVRGNHKALCGVYAPDQCDDQSGGPESASCMKCRHRYMQLFGRQPGNRGGRRS
jgi:hypothetical protein